MTDANERTCKTCACSLLVEPPRVATAQNQRVGSVPVRFCRLNPPQQQTDIQEVRTDKGLAAMPVMRWGFPPVSDTIVCWQWRPVGTPPGEKLSTMDQESIVKMVGLALAQGQGRG